MVVRSPNQRSFFADNAFSFDARGPKEKACKKKSPWLFRSLRRATAVSPAARDKLFKKSLSKNFARGTVLTQASPSFKFFAELSFKKATKNSITLSNFLTSKNKKRHNREFIPSALDIIRLIFRKETKTVVRGCGVGAADSFCIILHFFDFVNSSICTIFNLKIRRKSYKREKSADKPRRLCAF